MKVFVAVLVLGLACQAFALSTCEQEREQGNRGSPLLLGRFVPSCEKDGSYRNIQCREAVCYCVEPSSGRKIDNSEANIGGYGALKAKCAGFANLAKRDASKCEQQRETALTSGLIGAFAPLCDDDGSYARMQCRESVCFCADTNTGLAIEGSQGHVAGFDDIKRQCESGTFQNLAQLSECQAKRQNARNSGLIGAFVPRCEDDGRYHHTQCVGSTCYCVDRENGQKRHGSERHISTIEDVERMCQSYAKRSAQPCEQERYEAQRSNLLGRFVPKCESDGSYSSVQCREARCFCVEPETGNKIDNTETGVGGYRQLKKDCTTNTILAKREVSKCEQERDRSHSSGLIGAFAPACENDGSYSQVQCREAVCYCADPSSGKPISGTEGHVSGFEGIKQQCISGSFPSLAQKPTECKQKRTTYRWNKCPVGCNYFEGYGEALMVCCCD